MSELVSIITPIYNGEKYIEKTAKSVFAQTYANWEWIIVNDCSTDRSLQIIKDLSLRDSRIIVTDNLRNLKTAETRNRGIEIARGEFICFIDSDDLWHPQKLEKQITFMRNNDVGLSFHSYLKFWGDFEHLSSPLLVPSKVNYQDLLRTNSISCLSAMYDVRKIGKAFMPNGFKAREDYLCWLGILKKIDFAYGMNETLGYYRIVGNSYSSNKFEVANLQWRLYRDHEKLSLPKSIICFLFYSLNGFLKNRIY